MRIGIDLSPLCENPVRGVGRALAHLVAGLSRVLPSEDRLVGFQPRPAIEPFEGLDRVERVVPSGDEPTTPSAYRGHLRRLTPHQRLDAFVSPWSAFPALGVPVVVIVHELPFVRWGPIEGVRRTLAHRWWLRRDVARAARIVVPSAATRADLLGLHPAAEPCVATIPHGFDPTFWAVAHPPRPSMAPRQGLLVGATHRRKGLDVFLDAEEGLADLGLSWWLVGGPPRGLRRRVARRPSLRVVEGLGDEELRAAMQASDVLVYPSRSEGFGYPPLEAMAAGVPVVATAAGSIPEVCGGAARLVPAEDPAALASAIREVVLDDGVRRDLLARGHVRCRAFPLERVGEAWAALLRQVVEEAA